MKILYYTWDEITKTDVVSNLQRMGHDITLFTHSIKNYIKDVDLLNDMEERIAQEKKKQMPFDIIFSCNFIPLISKIALRNKIPYVSWTYDSPCMTMYSEMIFNPYNYMFHFDWSETERLKRLGVSHIYHLPLAVDEKRIAHVINNASNISSKLKNPGVSFMGNLYNNEVDLIKDVNGLPEYEKGYLEGIMHAQSLISGSDLLEEMLDNVFAERLGYYINFTKEEELFVNDRDMILNIVKKMISSRERINILKELAGRLPVTLYSQSALCNIPGVSQYGYIDYEHDMPVMFANSCINLNITLRNIKTAIPLRALDIMGAGGFLFTNYCPELSEYMTDGTEFVSYSDAGDCVEKAVYYMQHEELRKRIADSGRKKVTEMFTYDIQLEKMFQILRKEFS